METAVGNQQRKAGETVTLRKTRKEHYMKPDTQLKPTQRANFSHTIISLPWQQSLITQQVK